MFTCRNHFIQGRSLHSLWIYQNFTNVLLFIPFHVLQWFTMNSAWIYRLDNDSRIISNTKNHTACRVSDCGFTMLSRAMFRYCEQCTITWILSAICHSNYLTSLGVRYRRYGVNTLGTVLDWFHTTRHLDYSRRSVASLKFTRHVPTTPPSKRPCFRSLIHAVVTAFIYDISIPMDAKGRLSVRTFK